jgi:hypothetical protein
VDKKDLDIEKALTDRRQVLKAVGGSAVLVSVSGLAACGGGDAPAPAATPAPEPAAAPAPQPAPQPEPAAEPMEAAAPESTPEPAAEQPAAGGGLQPLDESDPQAQALAYVNDATTVDTSAQPRYEAGQACRNCALFMGGEDEWGPCSIFPGRLVNANGWCSVYSPKA